MQDYILHYQDKGTLYEIHLIDTPGFDDGNVDDTEVLSRIAEYVNTLYKLNNRLAGVLYLHDITKAKVGGAGKQVIRMLEEMVGKEEYINCKLATTKWGCTIDSQSEEDREKKLSEDGKYFAGMLGKESAQQSVMERFDPKTKERALEIILPFLKAKSTLQISREMVDPNGPKLALGNTKAGKLIANQMEKLSQAEKNLEKVQHAKEILSQKYNDDLLEVFRQEKEALRKKVKLQRCARWIMRFTIVGGAIAITVLTAGPGASAFVLVPAFEKVVNVRRKAEQKKAEQIEKKVKALIAKKRQDGSRLKQVDPDWLFDGKMKGLQDVEHSYSLESGSSDSDILEVARRGKVVGFARSDSELITDGAHFGMSENPEWSDSDAEFSGFEDYETDQAVRPVGLALGDF